MDDQAIEEYYRRHGAKQLSELIRLRDIQTIDDLMRRVLAEIIVTECPYSLFADVRMDTPAIFDAVIALCRAVTDAAGGDWCESSDDLLNEVAWTREFRLSEDCSDYVAYSSPEDWCDEIPPKEVETGEEPNF